MNWSFALGTTFGVASAVVVARLAERHRRRAPVVVRAPLLKHVVQLAFTPGAPIAEIIEAFDEMCTRMPDLILAYERGQQCSPEPHTKGLTHVFTLTFPGAAERDLSLPHPVHEEFGKRWVAPYLKELCVSDYEVEHELEVESEAPWWQLW